MNDTIMSWILTAMAAWAPPKRAADVARYEQIARDIVTVAYDADEEPAFEGEQGRAQTALLLASIASFESGYRAEIDDGRVRGDHGASVCMLQIKVGRGRTEEGWSARELLANRQLCVRAGLHRVKTSFKSCRGLRQGDRLGGYTHGRCFSQNQVARLRWDRVTKWIRKSPPVISDELAERGDESPGFIGGSLGEFPRRHRMVE